MLFVLVELKMLYKAMYRLKAVFLTHTSLNLHVIKIVTLKKNCKNLLVPILYSIS